MHPNQWGLVGRDNKLRRQFYGEKTKKVPKYKYMLLEGEEKNQFYRRMYEARKARRKELYGSEKKEYYRKLYQARKAKLNRENPKIKPVSQILSKEMIELKIVIEFCY